MRKSFCIDKFITVSAAARKIGVTGQALRRAIAEGRMIAVKKGRYWLIPMNEVEKYARIQARRNVHMDRTRRGWARHVPRERGDEPIAVKTQSCVATAKKC